MNKKKWFSTIIITCLMAWSLFACTASKTQSPAPSFTPRATPSIVIPSATDSPTQTVASTPADPTITSAAAGNWVNSAVPITPDNAREVKLLQKLEGFQGRVWTVAFINDGQYLATADRDSIDVWEAASYEIAFTFGLREVDFNGFSFSPDSRLLASGQAIWEVASQQVVHRLDPLGLHPAFSPDGTLLAVSGGKPIKLWDVASGELVRTFEAQENNDSFNIIFTQDGKFIADCGHEGTIRLWDVTTGKIVRTFSHGNHGDVHDIAFSADGKYLASVSTDYTVRLWEVASGENVQTMWHNDGLYGVAFSPDGRMVASASCDRTVKIWEAASGKLLATLRHADEVTTVAFSPDGKLIVSADYTEKVFVWGIME